MPRCRWEQAGCVEGLEHSSMMERRPEVGGGKSGMGSAFIVGPWGPWRALSSISLGRHLAESISGP